MCARRLDTLRGDLGLPAFPGRDVHHDFLCKVKPVYYMRPRAYSLSLSVPPFLIAYSGVLFRRYPEGFQTLLDRGRGTYRRVNVQADRPALGSFKSQLTASLKCAPPLQRGSNARPSSGGGSASAFSAYHWGAMPPLACASSRPLVRPCAPMTSARVLPPRAQALR